jgi:cation diffusion facilitator family transporter
VSPDLPEHHAATQRRARESGRLVLRGILLNAVLAAVKFAGGIFGHTYALIADGTESLIDILSSLIVWAGFRVASEPPDADHPYGHGKAEPIASAIVATMLLGAALWIVLTAVGEIREPHRSPAPFTLIVLLVVVAVKEGLFRFVSREGQAVDSSAVKTDAWHHRSDAITSVAAGIGITVALIGGKGFEAADDVAAVAAAGVIAWNGWHLLRPALNELMDTAPGPEVIDQIRRMASTTPGVDSVEKCIVRKVGYQYFVDMHVEVDPQMTVLRSHEIAHDVKDKIRENIPAVSDVLVHIEPLGIAAHERKINR